MIDVLPEVAEATGLTLRAPTRLAGGEQDGAWAVTATGPAGDDLPLVLKRQPTPWKVDRLLRALPAVRHAVANGWPAARWLAAGRLSDGSAYLLMERVTGAPVETLDQDTLTAVLAANARQAGLALDGAADDSAQLRDVLTGACSWRADVADRSPAGTAVVRRGEAVVARLGEADLPGGDVVHGDYSSSNLLRGDDGRIRFVDCETVGRGTRVRDLADLYRQGFLHGTAPDVLDRLRAAAEEIAGPAVFATCVVAVTYNNLAWWAEHQTVAAFDEVCPRVLVLLDGLVPAGGPDTRR